MEAAICEMKLSVKGRVFGGLSGFYFQSVSTSVRSRTMILMEGSPGCVVLNVKSDHAAILF